MTLTGEIDPMNIKQEISVFLRNQDVISTGTRGVTTTTDEFDGDGSTTTFTLTHSNVRNIRSVTVDGASKSFGTDWTMDYKTKIITFTTAPGSGTNNVDVEYDYGTPERIFTDYPRVDLHVRSYPRIAVEILSVTTKERAIGGRYTTSDIMIEIVCYDDNIRDLEVMVKKVRDAILNNKKNFYYFGFITPATMGPMFHDPARKEEILQRNMTFMIPHKMEIIS